MSTLMATITATCPTCGDVYLDPADVVVADPAVRHGPVGADALPAVRPRVAAADRDAHLRPAPDRRVPGRGECARQRGRFESWASVNRPDLLDLLTPEGP